MTDFAALAAPFPPSAVSWRIGTSNKKKIQRETGNQNAKATKGIALAYIDARDVMDRFDEVCGPGGWQCAYPHANGKTVCSIGVKVDDEWVWKADGAGDSDIEAEKGALSDAFKRAAVRWGVGRYLYHIASPWVDLDDREQISQADRRKLEALLTGAAPPKAAPADKPKAEAPKLSLAERADKFEDALRNSPPADLEKAWAKGSQLCSQLDTTMPERLAELEALYQGLIDNPFSKAA